MSIHAGGLGSSFSGSKSFRSCAGSIPSNTPPPPSPMPITLCQPTPYHAHARTHARTHTHTHSLNVQRVGSLIANYQLSEEPVACIFEVEVGHAEKKEQAVGGTAGWRSLQAIWREKLWQVVQLKARTRKSRNQRTLHGAVTHRRTYGATVSRSAARINTVKDGIQNKNRIGI